MMPRRVLLGPRPGTLLNQRKSCYTQPQSGSCMTRLIHVMHQGVWACPGWLWWHNWLQPVIRDHCTSEQLLLVCYVLGNVIFEGKLLNGIKWLILGNQYLAVIDILNCLTFL